ncbi:BTAD domain-containing putative transcriptional regulator [Amycolatopsis thermophila]|uniref:ATP/maltotriose-dependent transcriptional regulator MalT/DNA-binding SARP family transcriptional activator n=1 Tax=Amycolatopsis thermophila TaxID=206084 RepID=A0ABU0F053_9PSEU|nr:BTAD domain-containing putative transcriptional regulator [Amycolatopsis thermophila]MDQ0380485.1 ATP/maltotriose-dependent transcriptional regulator MalT/DNA-binding SARP family transcriptional activator [Amycolatopsis thermophila]
MPATSRIIRRKIMPSPVPASAVPRPRLEEQLTRLIRHNRVVCVYATAGAGKTTAVAQTVRGLGLPLCWLSVDTTEAATGRLLTYLEAALAVHVPSVAGLIRKALAAGLAHTEVAGMLAEAIGDRELLLVLDNMECLARVPASLAVVEAFLEYAPAGARVVLISRQELAFVRDGISRVAWLPVLGEQDLAFTAEEAAVALSRADFPDVDPEQAVAVTGGWVTGVLFEAWRSADHASGLGGEADPLHGYLATHILAQLSAEERDFLVETALLDEVTPARAEALGVTDAAARMHRLRHKRLPAAWDGLALRCHPRFREYLLARLERLDAETQRARHAAHARLLAGEKHLEEAVEEYLQAGELRAAAAVAEQVIDTVMERADFPVAKHWLDRLAPVRDDEHVRLTGAELMLAISDENYRLGVRIADRLARAGRRDEVAGSSSKLAAMMAWCYLHAGRLEDIRAVLAAGRAGADLDAMRYCMTLLDDVPQPRAGGALSGGPLDALTMRVHYYHGNFPRLLDPPSLPWAVKATESWRLGALLAMGHVDEAATLYRAICAERDPGVWLYSLFSVELLRRLGEPDQAWRALLKGRERLRASGSVMLELLSYVEEAALELRFNRDTTSARAALERVRSHPVGRDYAFVAEQAATWLGLAQLLDGDDRAATECLREAVSSMQRGHRILSLPAAAIYLAEAEWRTGDEERSDRASDLALAAAERQGSNHLLLEALTSFPLVLSRRLDAEPDADSPWHELGRALMSRGVALAGPLAPTIRLTEFGRVAIHVNGREVRPRIKKSYELLAYLAARRQREATKEELVDALFAGRHDDSTGAYLRQALRKLREVLPEDSVRAEGGLIRLSEHVVVGSDSGRLQCLISQAADLRGADRLATLSSALSIASGEYLPDLSSPWVEHRREQLAVLCVDTRCEAAELAFATGDFSRANTLAEEVLTEDPFRESMWRLKMRVADALGDTDRVIATYRGCEQALGQLGTRPASSTRRLLDDLRR